MYHRHILTSVRSTFAMWSLVIGEIDGDLQDGSYISTSSIWSAPAIASSMPSRMLRTQCHYTCVALLLRV